MADASRLPTRSQKTRRPRKEARTTAKGKSAPAQAAPPAPEELLGKVRRQQKANFERLFRQRYPNVEELQIVHRQAAGIDLGGKRSHFVALEIGDEIEVREFGMSTSQLLEMADYLCQHGVTSVAMESTGVYWVPVCDLLEACGLEVYLVNPSHAKNVPGRPKTDKLDCRWLQRLHKYGLLSASFRPAYQIRCLRSFLRHRLTLVQQTADYMRRLHKMLDLMNVRPHKVLSDLGGETGMRILHALVAGEQDPQALATLRHPRCQCSEEELAEQLQGFYQPHLLTQLASWLRLYEQLLEEITRIDAAIEEELQRLAAEVGYDREALLAKLAEDRHDLPTGKHAPGFNAAGYVQVITGRDPVLLPGIGPQLALSLLAELGWDMSKWPTHRHFCSHLTLAPQPKISGGRVLSARTRPGTHPAALLFRQAAAAIVKKNDCALAAFYHRLAFRRGNAKALTALARKLAILYYYLMKEGQAYVDVGVAAYEAHHREHQRKHLEKRARKLGFSLQPLAA